MTGSACDQARGAPYHFQFSRDAKEEECYEAMSICATGDAGYSDIWKTASDEGTIQDEVGKVRNNRTGIGTHTLEYISNGAPFISGKKYVAYTHYITDTSSYSAVAIGQKGQNKFLSIDSGGFTGYRLLYDDKKLIDTNVFLKNIANHKILGKGQSDDIQPSFTPPRVGVATGKKAEFVSAVDDIFFQVAFSSESHWQATYGFDEPVEYKLQCAYYTAESPSTPVAKTTSKPLQLNDLTGVLRDSGWMAKWGLHPSSKVEILGDSDKPFGLEFNWPGISSRQSADSDKTKVELNFSALWDVAKARGDSPYLHTSYTFEFEDMGPNEQQVSVLSKTHMKANFNAQYGISNVNVDSRKVGDVFNDVLSQVYTLDDAIGVGNSKIHLVVRQIRKLKVVPGDGRDYSSVPILPGKFNKPKYSAGQHMYKDDEPPKVWRNYWREVYTSKNEHSITDVAKWDNAANSWELDYAGKENARRSIKYFVINSFDEIESAKIFSALTPESRSNSVRPALNKLSFDKFGNITIYGEKDTTPRVPKAITYKSPFGFKIFNDDKSINCPSSGSCKIDRVIFYRNPLYSKFFSDTGTTATASADRLKFENTREIHVYASKQSEVGNSGLEVAGNRGHSKDENIKDKYLTNTLTGFGVGDAQNWYTGDRDCIMQVEGKYILKRLEHYVQWRKEYLGILVSRLNKITKTVNRETNGDLKHIAEWGNEVTEANKIEYKKYYNIFHALKAKVTATTDAPSNYSSPYPNDPGAGKWDELKPDNVPLYELLYNPIHHAQFKKYYNALLIENKVLDLVDSVKNSRSKVGETRYTSNIKFDSSKTGSNEEEYRDYDNVIQNYCNSMVNKDRMARKFYNPVTYTIDDETVYEKYTDYSCSLTAANLHMAYTSLMGKNFTYNTLMYKKFSVNFLNDKFQLKKVELGLLEGSPLTETQKQEVLDDLLAEQDEQRWPNLTRSNLGTLYTEGKVIENANDGTNQNESTGGTVSSGDDSGEVIRGALCSKDSTEKKGYGPGFFIANFFGSETGTSDSFIQDLFSAALVENNTLESSRGSRKCHIYTKGTMAKCIMEPSIYINVTCKNVIQNTGGNMALNNVELTNNCPLNVDLSQTTINQTTIETVLEPPALKIETTGPSRMFFGPSSTPYRLEANSNGALQSVSELPDDKRGTTEINGVTVKCKNPESTEWTACESLEMYYNGKNVNGVKFLEEDFFNQPSNGVEITFKAQSSKQSDNTKYGEIKKRILLVEPVENNPAENCFTFDNYNCTATSIAALNSLGNNIIQEKNANGVSTGRIRYETDLEKRARENDYAAALDESNRLYNLGCNVDQYNTVTQIRTFSETETECRARLASEEADRLALEEVIRRREQINIRKVMNSCKRYNTAGELIAGLKICDEEGYLTPGCMDPLYENYSPDYGAADNSLCGNVNDQEFTDLNKKRITSGGEEVLDDDELKFVFNRFNNKQHIKHTVGMSYADTNNDGKLTVSEFQTYKGVLDTYGGYQVSVSEAPCGVDSVFINSFNTNSDVPITLSSNCEVAPAQEDPPEQVEDPDPTRPTINLGGLNVEVDPATVFPGNNSGDIAAIDFGLGGTTMTAENRYYRKYNIGQFVKCFNNRSKMCMVSADPDNSNLKVGTNQDLETKRTCLINNVYKYYDDLTPDEKSQCTSSMAWKDGQLVDYFNLYAFHDKTNDGRIYCDADAPEGLDAVPETDKDSCIPRPTTVCSKTTCSQECLNKFIKTVAQCRSYNCAFNNTQCPVEDKDDGDDDDDDPPNYTANPPHVQKKDNTMFYLMIGGGILLFLLLIVIVLIIF